MPPLSAADMTKISDAGHESDAGKRCTYAQRASAVCKLEYVRIVDAAAGVTHEVDTVDGAGAPRSVDAIAAIVRALLADKGRP